MPVPAIVAGAAAVAGRLAAKKVAKEAAKKVTKKAVEKVAKNSVKSIPAGSKPLTKKTSGKPNYIYKDKEMAAVKESLKNVKLKKQGKK